MSAGRGIPDATRAGMSGEAAGGRRRGRQVDLIVCGSPRNRGLSRWVLGSTGDYLAPHAHVPLLIAPRAASAGPPRVQASG